jgi:Glyoxalase/Bleomycin resistance protein/Dioxygenase superfamily
MSTSDLAAPLTPSGKKWPDPCAPEWLYPTAAPGDENRHGGPGDSAIPLGFPNQPKKVGGFSGVVLEVDDVYKTAEELEKRGVELTEKPRTEPWGGWATFQDSEGNIHGLHSPAAAGAGKQ